MKITISLLIPIILAAAIALAFAIVCAFFALFVKKNSSEPKELSGKKAVLLCNGVDCQIEEKNIYEGIKSCNIAKNYVGSSKSCSFACLGFGDCIQVCHSAAITICEGIAKIDRNLCDGCGDCASVCPQQLIALLDENQSTYIACKSTDNEQLKSENCKVSCDGCKKCMAICPANAITITDHLASIDPNKCNSCGKCSGICPNDVLKMINN